MLTQSALKSLLSYDENTGLFCWIKRGHGRPIDKQAGSINKIGYMQICVNKKQYRAHRLAWLYVYGSFPIGMIDHINGIKSDNRICNLRDVSSSVNNINAFVSKSKNHKYLGVHKNKSLFGASIKANGKRHFLGMFNTPEEAQRIYLAAKAKLHPLATVSLGITDPLIESTGDICAHAKKGNANRNSSSGYRGISLNKKGYQAEIMHKGKRVYLGTYPTAQDAHKAYLLAKAEYAKNE